MHFEPEVNMQWGARGLLKWVFSRCWVDSREGVVCADMVCQCWVSERARLQQPEGKPPLVTLPDTHAITLTQTCLCTHRYGFTNVQTCTHLCVHTQRSFAWLTFYSHKKYIDVELRVEEIHQESCSVHLCMLSASTQQIQVR